MDLYFFAGCDLEILDLNLNFVFLDRTRWFLYLSSLIDANAIMPEIKRRIQLAWA